MIELESQGAGAFFGEPEFDVKDMLHTTSDGRGIVTCLELADVQDKPLLWSTFMMWMLAELYHNLPEAGDLPKPKLAFFFDEAHLLFADASKEFLSQVQQVVRLIRSKGVGVYFVTQTPKDVPDACWRSSAIGSSALPRIRPTTTRPSAHGADFPQDRLHDLEATLTSSHARPVTGWTGAAPRHLWPRAVPPTSLCKRRSRTSCRPTFANPITWPSGGRWIASGGDAGRAHGRSAPAPARPGRPPRPRLDWRTGGGRRSGHP
jgi:hypothetical protein